MLVDIFEPEGRPSGEHVMVPVLSINMCVHVTHALRPTLTGGRQKAQGYRGRNHLSNTSLSPIFKVANSCSASDASYNFVILWGSLGRGHTTSTLNSGGRARVLLN